MRRETLGKFEPIKTFDLNEEEEKRLKTDWMNAMEEHAEFRHKEKEAARAGNHPLLEETTAANRKLNDATQEIKRRGGLVEREISHRAMKEIAANPENFALKYPELVKQALVNEIVRINNLEINIKEKIVPLRLLGLELANTKRRGNINNSEYKEKLAIFQNAEKMAIAEKNEVMQRFIKVLERPEAERIYAEQKEKNKGQFFLD
ncbi:hypothetical protein COU00_01080 [Candidatus Falkowbacteria bacterium CG10_big_fil_rev_8_21_14_0_10_43_11]|uniref:Uncharacterized protein n=1 Tax=Candidatus Falkowbacteria bacterium CG10_big_fil_rev_8_21_14_0_10_43_11 TaxID=1974568 RepID=A0A2M6WMM1_9BACT|nr:MAG: hypothetical protein COU00_01080 [Candidatus Falkowbacteria bacterium CG10_big_fil_rev_8_21_14_0_10_43_11]